MSLEDLRKRIDLIDTQIVKLLSERINIAEEVGKEKGKLGKQIEDMERERKVLAHVKRIAQEENLNQEDIIRIYQQIVTASKKQQGKTRVAFQGELGAYSEEAAFRFFGHSIQVQPCEGLEDVFKAVEQGQAQFGIIPVENSLEGSISQSYDLLLDSSLKVCGETEHRVIHCLIANPGTGLEQIKKIYSHPQALAQSRNFLKHMDSELIPTYDTAGSVKMIKKQGITDGGAIASARAAEIYSMKIVTRGIEDNPNNFTRFFILSRQDAPPSGTDKTSIVFAVKHRPGALYECLKEFAARKINLTKLESRPTRQKPWEYNFYMDFEGHREDEIFRDVLANIDKTTIFVKVLGSYPKAENHEVSR